MKGEKSGAPVALGPASPFSFATLPTPISRKGGAAPAPPQHSSQWKDRQGERKGLI